MKTKYKVHDTNYINLSDLDLSPSSKDVLSNSGITFGGAKITLVTVSDVIDAISQAFSYTPDIEILNDVVLQHGAAQMINMEK